MSDLPASPAQAYQDYFGPAIFEPLSRHVVELAAPAPGERVLDIACGSGILTRAVAGSVAPAGRAVGLDISPMMIEVADSIDGPPGETIDWRVGDGTAVDLPSASFDLVCCQQGLQFFPDRRAGACEMRRLVDEGGRAVIAVWRDLDHHPLYAALADAEEPHLGALGVDITHDELVAPFSFGDPDALHVLLAEAGFHSVDVVQRTIDARFADADSFVARMEFAYGAVIPQFVEDPAAFEAYLDAISTDTQDIIDAHRDGDHIVVPMHANIAVAQTA